MQSFMYGAQVPSRRLVREISLHDKLELLSPPDALTATGQWKVHGNYRDIFLSGNCDRACARHRHGVAAGGCAGAV
ncbi:MAG: hypothetical protein K2Y51_10095, partial [Gammaproteobacteria bacterium]|nr:hypothetical protein [Gammaproteobacteria bacterium]